MVLLQSAVTLIYYGLVAGTAAVLVVNFVKATKWDREVLYLVVLLPFLLRLFRLK